MQVQQSEVNLGSAKKPDVNNQTQSRSSDTSETKQVSPFEDHLNRQIEQSKKPISEENSVNKQDDSGHPVDEVSASEAHGLESEEQTPETTEMTGIEGETSIQIEEPEMVPATLMQQIDDVEMTSLTTKTSTQLPQTGNVLPLSEGEKLSGEATEIPQVKSNPQLFVQPSAEKRLDAAAVSPLKQMPAPAEVTESVSVTARSQTIINSDAKPDSPVAYKAVSLTDKINTQGGKLMSPVNEIPAGEIINQTTRLQQVPMATEVSSNLSAPQNMNTISSVVLSEINTSLNNPSSFNNALGTTLSSTITTALQNPQWSQQMTDQVSFMLKGGLQQAEIKLNPAHLGPMEIKLSINDDQASVSFVAQHAPVRDALDAAIPRLREMLEQQGLNLADVDVSTQSQQQQAGDGGDNEMNNLASDDEKNALEGQAESQVTPLNMKIESGVSIYA